MEELKNATPDSSGDVMTSSNMTVNNVTYSRADLVAANDEIAMTLLPAMLVLGVMVVLGVLGNSLVCYIFCFRLRPSTQNYLIVYLAVFDLLSSTIGMTAEIADMRYMLMFESEAVCKIMRFINSFCAMGSVFTLVVIAVDRFRKVCRPLKGQLSVSHIKYCLIPITGAAMFLAWPAFVIYGLRTTESGVPGIPGTDCSTSDFVRDTPFPLIYNSVLLLAFVVITTSLMIIYCHVLRETKRHVRYMKKTSDFNMTPSHPDHHEDSSSAGHYVHPHSVSTTRSSLPSDDKEHITSGTPRACTGSVPKSEMFVNIAASGDNNLATKPPGETSEPPLQEECIQNVENSPTQTDTSLRPSPPESQLCEVPLFHSETNDQVTSHLPSASPNDGGNDVTTTSQKPKTSTSNPGVFSVTPKTTLPCEKTKKPKKSRAERFESKTTMIAFLITLVFILSFLPHLSLQVSKMIFKGYDYNLDNAGLVLFNLFLRSYYLNSILNPFIYGVLNVKFKEEVKKLLKQVHTFCKR